VIGSVALSLVLTALFVATGGYALLRWASLRAGVAGRMGDEVAELTHVLMSVAMIAMTWGYSTRTADVAQIVLFAGLGGYFLVRLVIARLSRTVCPCPAPGYHLLVCVAMVWMVVAMPWLMAALTSKPAGAAASMDMDGMSMPMPAGDAPVSAPWFTVPVTVAVALALVAGAGYWVRRLSRLVPRPVAAPAASSEPAAPVGTTAPIAAAAPTVTGAATAVAPPAVRTQPVGPLAERVLALLTPRSDALCHLLMSLAMATMTLLMV
jgi:hypothetical protein